MKNNDLANFKASNYLFLYLWFIFPLSGEKREEKKETVIFPHFLKNVNIFFKKVNLAYDYFFSIGKVYASA